MTMTTRTYKKEKPVSGTINEDPGLTMKAIISRRNRLPGPQPQPATAGRENSIMKSWHKTVLCEFVVPIVWGSTCQGGKKEEEIDCRPSDAVALAYRFGCPIYCEETVLKMAGIGESELEQSEAEMQEPKPKESKPRKRDKSLATLQSELTKAIAREDYEQASKIRDEIEQRQEKE